MTDLDAREALAAKHERNRTERIEGFKRWTRYFWETPVERWVPEQNAVVDAQVRAAREADLDAKHRRRVERVARELEDLEG